VGLGWVWLVDKAVGNVKYTGQQLAMPIWHAGRHSLAPRRNHSTQDRVSQRCREIVGGLYQLFLTQKSLPPAAVAMHC
jgi:hypothetical protein